MSRVTVLRSLITGLGLAIAATACAPDNLAGPQASATIAAAPAATTSDVAPGASGSVGLLGAVLQAPTALVQTINQVVSSILYPVVQRQVALPKPITVTRMIGVGGGAISIPQAGMSITFAPGALLMATSITVTADSGKAVSYEFGPHGTQFHAPVTIAQDMSLTTLADDPSSASSIQGGYTPNGLGDIVNGLLARVAELLKATTTIVIGPDGEQHLGTSSFIVKHFSGYILIGA